MPYQSILKSLTDQYEQTIGHLKEQLTRIRAGRANASILDTVKADYYGTLTPISQMAQVNVTDSQTLTIRPFDKSQINAIEKALMKADLGLSVSSDSECVRAKIAALTEERRKDLANDVKRKGEDSKVTLRNQRRDANKEIDDLKNSGDVSEDQIKVGKDDVQSLIKKYEGIVDQVVKDKTDEVMTV